MNIRFILFVFFLSLSAASCERAGRILSPGKTSSIPSREQMEENGRQFLNSAREAMKREDFATARELIKRMRKECRNALNAREDGIILLDSVELAEARKELERTDSLIRTSGKKDPALESHFDELCQRIKFYNRKLEHDRKNKKKH